MPTVPFTFALNVNVDIPVGDDSGMAPRKWSFSKTGALSFRSVIWIVTGMGISAMESPSAACTKI